MNPKGTIPNYPGIMISALRGFLTCITFCLIFASVRGADAPLVDLSSKSARPTPDWIRNAVIYEIFPRQFSEAGNFAGITARLDELKDLGIDILWLMPIQPIGRLKAKGSIGSPYAIRDYYGINPDYGTKDDLHALVDGAHARGMKVVIDIVANHTSWDNVLMADKSYYKQDGSGNVIPPHPDWADVAALNYNNPATRTYMRTMLKYWASEFRLDGFRCDVASEVPTDFWEDVRRDVEQIRPGFFMLAEASKTELLVNAFDLDYGWPMLKTMNEVLMKGVPADHIRNTWLTDEQGVFPKGALHMHCTDDHDEPRAISRYGWNAALAASAIMFTLDGVPLIYNGMEVGDSSESSDPALFEKLPIFWHPKGRESFRGVYRNLIALRHEHRALTQGSLAWVGNSNPDRAVTFLRTGGGETFLTVVNLSNRPVELAVSLPSKQAFRLALASDAEAAVTPADFGHLSLNAFEWRIYSAGKGD